MTITIPVLSLYQWPVSSIGLHLPVMTVSWAL